MKLPNWSLLDNKLPTLRMPAMKEPVAKPAGEALTDAEDARSREAEPVRQSRAAAIRATSALSLVLALVAALTLSLAPATAALGESDKTTDDGISVSYAAPTEMITVAPTEAPQSSAATAEPAPTDFIPSEPVSREVALSDTSTSRYVMTEFGKTAPADVAEAFAHPKLEGWECLSGATWTTDGATWKGDQPDERGVVAFGKGDERLLCALYRKPTKTTAWTLVPVGEKALLKGREFRIACVEKWRMFEIVYPISADESERFIAQVRLTGDEDAPSIMLELYEYRRMNDKTGDGIVINNDAKTDAERYLWYHVTNYKAGEPTGTAFYPVTLSPYMNYLDAEAFPTSEEECKAAQGYTVPEGYGVTCGVHLRRGKSSRSADMGDFNAGTLVHVLGLEPGDPYDWVKVRIGRLEGYMSSIYVQYYDETPCAMLPIEQYVPLPVAQAKKDTVLKAGTGWFDGRVGEVKAGARMHVLADYGNWLYVCVPSGDLEWYMDVNGTYGYMWTDDVIRGATALELDWQQ